MFRGPSRPHFGQCRISTGLYLHGLSWYTAIIAIYRTQNATRLLTVIQNMTDAVVIA